MLHSLALIRKQARSISIYWTVSSYLEVFFLADTFDHLDFSDQIEYEEDSGEYLSHHSRQRCRTNVPVQSEYRHFVVWLNSWQKNQEIC